MEKKRILIVEDDPDTCLLLSQLFQKVGYDLTITDNGQDAIVNIKTVVPDLVIFDVNLPGMDGWETFARIRQDYAVPAICLSAASLGQFTFQAQKLGEVEYIHKPFYNDELLARVDALVNRTAVAPAYQEMAWDKSKPSAQGVRDQVSEVRKSLPDL